MNRLTVEVEHEWFGPCFNLMIDGEHICDVLECAESGIPAWIAENGIPRYPVGATAPTPDDMRIVAVCGCSVEGCGHLRCEVRREGETVIFQNFVDEHGRPGKAARFVFSVLDFEAAERLIVETMSGIVKR